MKKALAPDHIWSAAEFYEGKVAAARFFAHQRFPLLAAERSIAEAADNDLMDLHEAAF